MNIHLRFRHLAGMLVGAMLVFPLAGQAQQQVKIGGQAVCTGDVTMNVDPAGNLNFPNCTAVSTGGGGGTPTAPVCTNVSTNVNADAAATPTITSSCSNGGSTITGYQWTAVAAAPPIVGLATGASITAGPFPTAGAGPFQYTVTATNSVGTSNSATVTVSVVTPGVCGTATATASFGSTIYDTATPSIHQGSFVSYKLPTFPTAGKFVKFKGVNNGAGSGNDATHPLITEFAVSSCPGDFTNIPTACRLFAAPDNGVLNLTTHTVASATGATGCALVTGQQYYFNVRNVDANLANTCQSNSCSLIVIMSN